MQMVKHIFFLILKISVYGVETIHKKVSLIAGLVVQRTHVISMAAFQDSSELVLQAVPLVELVVLHALKLTMLISARPA